MDSNHNNSDASPDDLAQLAEILRRIGPHGRSRVFSGAASLPSPPMESNQNPTTFPPASQHPSLSHSFQPTGSPTYFPNPTHSRSLQPLQFAGNSQPVPLARQSIIPNASAPRISVYQSPRTEQPQGHPHYSQAFPSAPGRQTLLFNAPAASQSQPPAALL